MAHDNGGNVVFFKALGKINVTIHFRTNINHSPMVKMLIQMNPNILPHKMACKDCGFL